MEILFCGKCGKRIVLCSECSHENFIRIPSIIPEMVFIPKGTFEMGDRWGDGDDDEKPVHSVTVDGFWMDVTEVTNAEFKKFVDAIRYNPEGNWSYDSSKADYPAVYVTWNDAIAYCEWAGKRLPTEAEWEYAAGGPEHFKWSLGDEFDGNKYTYYENKGFGRATRPVGSHSANGYGLYDMSGNVWEWCADWYSENYYANSPSENPKGPLSGSERVLRGGCWRSGTIALHSASRGKFDSSYQNDGLGFRCSR